MAITKADQVRLVARQHSVLRKKPWVAWKMDKKIETGGIPETISTTQVGHQTQMQPKTERNQARRLGSVGVEGITY